MTEIRSEDLARLISEVSGTGEERIINFWWHSHGESDVFWSKTDEEACDMLLTFAPKFVSMVINSAGRAVARVDVENELGRYNFRLPIEVLSTLSEGDKELLDEELREKMKPRVVDIPETFSSLSGKYPREN